MTPSEAFEAWIKSAPQHDGYNIPKAAWFAALEYAANECRRIAAYKSQDWAARDALNDVADRLSPEPKGTP